MSGFDVDLNISGKITLTPELIALLREVFQQTPAPIEPVEPEPIPPVEPVAPPSEPTTDPVEPTPEPAPPSNSRYLPGPNSLVFYVSSSAGADTNSGVFADAPLRTLRAAYEKLRPGQPDHILLKRGDVWINESFSNWRKGGGKSTAEPMVLGSYGTGNRPVIKTGSQAGFDSVASSAPSVDHLVIKDIVFIAHTRNPDAASFVGPAGNPGVRILTGANDFELYNCGIHYYTGGLILQKQYVNQVDNCLIHYTNIHGCYNSRSQGVYFDTVTNSRIDHCVIDSNGYNNNPLLGSEMRPDVYSHNMYVQYNCDNIVVSNCLISRGSSHGLQLRCSGEASSNAFIRNPIALQLGHREDSGGPKAIGADGNVVLEGTEITVELQRAWGIHLEMRNQGAAWVNNNVVAHALQPSRNSRSIYVDGIVSYTNNRIHNWPVDSREYGNGFGETLDEDAIYPFAPSFDNWVTDYDAFMDGPRFLDHIAFLELSQYGDIIDGIVDYFQEAYAVI
jgi:hypothetical protein